MNKQELVADYSSDKLKILFKDIKTLEIRQLRNINPIKAHKRRIYEEPLEFPIIGKDVEKNLQDLAITLIESQPHKA